MMDDGHGSFKERERQEQDFYLATWARVLVSILVLTGMVEAGILVAKAMDIWAALHNVILK